MKPLYFPKIQTKEQTRIFRFSGQHGERPSKPVRAVSFKTIELNDRVRAAHETSKENPLLFILRNWVVGSMGLFLALLFSFKTPVQGGNSFGQASDSLNIGAGARAMGMGSAFTGLADDASASYFNPAGLAYLDEHQLMAMHAPLFMDSNLNYLSSAHPFGDKWGALSLSGSLLLSDGFEVRDKSNTVTDGDGSFRNTALFAGYAHKITQKLSVGTAAKLLQQKIANLSGSGFGYDIGLMYRPTPLFGLGVAVANVNSPSITIQSSADVFQPVTRVGLASEVFKDRLTLTADAVQIRKEGTNYAAGAELSVNRMIRLRGGYNANRSFTAGLGVSLKPLRIDYAFSDSDLGGFSKISFTWAWHNIYKTDLEPPMKEGRAIYPLQGFENKVVFRTFVPQHTVANWSLSINDKEGKTVRTLQGDLRPPENIEWDAKNEFGEPIVDGNYAYRFVVKYRNGKEWKNAGLLQMDLPNRDVNEVIDASLQINGTRVIEVSQTENPAGTPAAAPAPQNKDLPVVEQKVEEKPSEPTAQPNVTKPAEAETK